MTVVTLRAQGSADAETAWGRYLEPQAWPGWAPQITRVEASAPRIALGPAIEPRQQREERPDHCRQHDRPDDLEAAWEIFEQLEETKEVPLGPRDEGRVGWIGGPFHLGHAAPREGDQREQHD